MSDLVEEIVLGLTKQASSRVLWTLESPISFWGFRSEDDGPGELYIGTFLSRDEAKACSVSRQDVNKWTATPTSEEALAQRINLTGNIMGNSGAELVGYDVFCLQPNNNPYRVERKKVRRLGDPNTWQIAKSRL